MSYVYTIIIFPSPTDNFSTTEIKGRSRAKEKQVDVAKKVIKKLHFEYKPESFDNPDTETMWEIIKALALNRSQMEPVIDDTGECVCMCVCVWVGGC